MGREPTQKRTFTGSAHTLLGLVQAVPFGKCWEQSLLPTHSVKEQEACYQHLSFFPHPFCAEGSLLSSELMTFCFLPQTSGETPGWAGCLWLPGFQVQWHSKAPLIPLDKEQPGGVPPPSACCLAAPPLVPFPLA